MKVSTKVIGTKAYAKLVALANTGKFADGNPSAECLAALQTLELTYCNLDCAAYAQWAKLGLTYPQCDNLVDKIQDLADDTWLVVTVTE